MNIRRCPPHVPAIFAGLAILAGCSESPAPTADHAAAPAAPGNQLQTILSVGVQDLGETFFDLLLETAKTSEDPAFRIAATGALARVEDPALVKKLQGALLAGEFSNIERARIMQRQMIRTATTQSTFDWMRANDEQIISLIPEAFRSRFVLGFGGSFCDSEKATEWQAFIESHADSFPGYERPLAQATEQNQLCSALKQARAGELISTFASY